MGSTRDKKVLSCKEALALHLKLIGDRDAYCIFGGMPEWDEKSKKYGIPKNSSNKKTEWLLREAVISVLAEYITKGWTVWISLNDKETGNDTTEGVTKILCFWFDFDAPRTNKAEPATDEERKKTCEEAKKFKEWINKTFGAIGFMACSGNGFHLFFPVEGFHLIGKAFRREFNEKQRLFYKKLKDESKAVFDVTSDVRRVTQPIGCPNVKIPGKPVKTYWIDKPGDEDIERARKTNLALLEAILNTRIGQQTPIVIAGPHPTFDELLKTDTKLKDLYEGNWKRYGFDTRSDAEESLVTKLCMIDFSDDEIGTVMRSCKIGKWLEKGDTYKDKTIEKGRKFAAEHKNKGGVQEKKSKSEPSLIDRTLQVALDNCELVHDQYNEGYAVVNSGANKTVIKLHSREFKFYIGRLYYDREKKGLPKEAFSSALITLEGIALYDGEERVLYNRVASRNGKIYYDMADKEARIIEIDGNGWRFITDSPVLFRREQHQNAQVEPLRGGDVNKLWNYIKLDNETDRHLMLPCIITDFIPTIDHVIIVIWGDHGGGKSFACENIKEVIDPSSTKTRALSKKDDDLILTLYHNWLTAFDNISGVLKQGQSDILARASTGAGVSKRMLYTDDNEVIYNFKRCTVLNGLNIPLTQPDIMDRTIVFKFKRIKSPASKEVLEKIFEKDRAEIFGGLLDLLSKTLKIKDNDNIKIPPGLRMYDFAQWGEAVSQAAGNEKDKFLTLYLNKKVDDNYEVIQSSKIGYVLWLLVAENSYTILDKDGKENNQKHTFFDDDEKWKGTPTELLKIFIWKAAETKIDKRSEWVDSPEALSKELGKLKTNFRAVGIDIKIGREHQGRFIRIFKAVDDMSAPLTKKKTGTTDTPVTNGDNSDGCDGCDTKHRTWRGEGREDLSIIEKDSEVEECEEIQGQIDASGVNIQQKKDKITKYLTINDLNEDGDTTEKRHKCVCGASFGTVEELRIHQANCDIFQDVQSKNASKEMEDVTIIKKETEKDETN